MGIFGNVKVYFEGLKEKLRWLHKIFMVCMFLKCKQIAYHKFFMLMVFLYIYHWHKKFMVVLIGMFFSIISITYFYERYLTMNMNTLKEDLEKWIKNEEERIAFYRMQAKRWNGTIQELNEKLASYCQVRIEVYLDLLCRIWHKKFMLHLLI